MKRKITYLNCILTVIAVALTIIILQNAGIIQPAYASGSFMNDVVDVNIKEVGGSSIYSSDGIPVEVTNTEFEITGTMSSD